MAMYKRSEGQNIDYQSINEQTSPKPRKTIERLSNQLTDHTKASAEPRFESQSLSAENEAAQPQQCIKPRAGQGPQQRLRASDENRSVGKSVFD